MARLIAPNGSTINVSDDKAERLLGQGYKSADEKATTKTTSKRASSSKTEK